MMDLQCRCMGLKKDYRCHRQANGEDSLCFMCRLGDGTCCEDYGDALDTQLIIQTRRAIQLQRGLEREIEGEADD